MKKLNIRNKDLKRLGIPEGKLRSEIIHVVNRHFLGSKKMEVLETIQDLLHEPKAYVKHEFLSGIAAKLLEKESAPSSKKKSSKSLQMPVKDLLYKVYGKDLIDGAAIQQMDAAIRLPVSVKGALMADAHSGYGLPIGGVLATQNAVIPYGVGMDIGCRMCMSIYNISSEYLQKHASEIKDMVIEHTRFGKAEFNDIREHSIVERKEFKEIPLLKKLKDKAFAQLGTSGGGNHFVDVGLLRVDEHHATDINLPPGIYVAILSHSGSRGFGAEIARHYTSVAKKLRDLGKGAANLAWLGMDEEEGIEYWQAMNLAGDYASANHHIIHDKIAAALREKPVKLIENHHNFAWKETISGGTEVIVHRKGATPASKGVLGIIPGSMATPAYVVVGKGNDESLHSASHGAGRIMSRAQAKASFSARQLQNLLRKNNIELLGGGLDESPMAYKDIDKVMQTQSDLVKVTGIFYPKIVRMSGK